MARRPPGPRTSARWLGGALVAVLAVAAIVLAVIAIDRVRPATPTTHSEPAPSFSFGAEPSTTPTPTPTPSASASYPRAEERFLSVGSGGIWRGIAGECGSTSPLIERSVDGGQTWEDVTPTYRGIGQLLSLDSFAGTEAEAIARMGTNCETQALRTFTQGEFWEPYPEVLEAASYLDPSAPPTLVTPSGLVPAPCADPRSVRASAGTVALVCEGSAYVLDNGQWLALPVPNAVNVAIAGDRFLVAARSAACVGLEVSAAGGPGFSEVVPAGCAAVDPAAPAAVAPLDGGALLWSGQTAVRLP